MKPENIEICAKLYEEKTNLLKDLIIIEKEKNTKDKNCDKFAICYSSDYSVYNSKLHINDNNSVRTQIRDYVKFAIEGRIKEIDKELSKLE